LENREPTKEESSKLLDTYTLRWNVTLDGPRKIEKGYDKRRLTLRIWDPLAKHFPGWNPPVVEVFAGANRLACQELDEVGWAVDVWATNHEGQDYLYVRTNHRHRPASGTNVYKLNPNSLKLEHGGVVFSKEELEKEATQYKAMFEHADTTKGEQAGADQPATKPADKPPVKDQPSTSTPKDGPR